jgi:hypothetical protein
MLCISYGLDKNYMDMLEKQNKLVGVFNTWWRHIKSVVTRVAYKFQASRQNTMLDTSSSKKPDQFETMNVLTESQRQQHISEFMKSPEGQRVKAELTLKAADEMMLKILQRLNQIEKSDLASQMMLHLALREMTETVLRNEKLLETQS